MSPDFWRIAASTIVVGLGIYAILAICLYAFQSHLVYFPQRSMGAVPSDAGLSFETIQLETSDGIKLHAWFVPAPRPRGVLLYFHGNAGNISHRLEALSQFHRLGMSTLILDYRGYGQSEGSPSEEGTYRDAEAAWQYLTVVRGLQPEQIILLGRSLGGAIASWLAGRVRPRALVIESTFTSIPDRGAEVYPFFPVRMLARIEYNTLEYIGNVRCPLLIVHSPEDEIVPFSHGQRLFDAAGLPKEFLQISGGHNEGFFVSAEQYERGLSDFFSRY